jgi:hypothetical protein
MTAGLQWLLGKNISGFLRTTHLNPEPLNRSLLAWEGFQIKGESLKEPLPNKQLDYCFQASACTDQLKEPNASTWFGK